MSTGDIVLVVYLAGVIAMSGYNIYIFRKGLLNNTKASDIVTLLLAWPFFGMFLLGTFGIGIVQEMLEFVFGLFSRKQGPVTHEPTPTPASELDRLYERDVAHASRSDRISKEAQFRRPL
jgi:hypothetical protein